MDIIDKIIATVIIIITLAIQFAKYKYPAIFYNFGRMPSSGGFGINSKWKSSKTDEVTKYKMNMKKHTIIIIVIEVLLSITYFMLEK
ncbi:MAG: hypothetical protein A2Y23_11610 [Clostridiales bacterium GWB2_37_7]|nr:MAG: hypothetical protein A2Y23_11610 [Clostridiales bacterium GWB2_37_7]